MSQKRKTYTAEFKREALKLIGPGGKPIAEVERDLGLSPGTIHRWRHELKGHGQEAFPGHGRLHETEARLRQLERENRILRQERDILKKAIAVFSGRPQ